MTQEAHQDNHKDLLRALQATGASMGEAFAVIGGMPLGRAMVRALWRSFLEESPEVGDALLVLLEAAEASPRFARELLQIWFLERVVEGSIDLSNGAWVRSLPPGTHVRGHLELNGCSRLVALPRGLRLGRDLEMDGCSRITSLPENFWVGGDLCAECCRSLRTLPGAMQVGGDLYLTGSPWDGVVPAGVRVMGRIVR